MIIQHNIPAINSHRNLGINNAQTAKNLEKLSSGYRINRAGDDAAGLAISEKMRGQIRGLAMAEQNTQNAVSLIQTAEGGLNETHAILQRMRELAVQASNGTYQEEDRLQIELEFQNLKDEITRIAESTHYNGIKLLNGDMDVMKYGEADTLTTITAALNKNIFATGAAPTLSAKVDIEISLDENGDLSARHLGGGTAVGNMAIAANGTITFVEDGNNITVNDAMTQANLDRLKEILADSGSVVNIQLATNGNFTITSQPTYDIFTDHTGFADIGMTVTNASAGRGNYNVSMVRDGAYVEVTVTDTVSDTTTTQRIKMDQMMAGPQTVAGFTFDATVDADRFEAALKKGIEITNMKVVDNGAATQGMAFDFTHASVGVKNDLVFQIGANGGEDQRVYLTIADMSSTAIGLMMIDKDGNPNIWEKTGEALDQDYFVEDASVADIDQANLAIEIISAATNMVSAQRAELGAMQNRLEHTLNNLGVTKENLTAAESVIRDVDMAKEMMEFTKNNILVQASQAMLAQATQLPQGVLQLLR